MDTIFVLDDAERSNLLRLFFQSFGCTYICIWSCLPNPPSRCLVFKDGLLMEENNRNYDQASSSLARRLFAEYKQSSFNVENECVPGFAFKNNNPYLELSELDLQGFASTEVQRKFYTEAKIKRAIFMGCTNGEIELGFANVTRLNMEMELRSWFSDSFLRQVQFKENGELYSLMGYQDQQAGSSSSSSSSLRSLSIGSPETTALLSNFSTAPSYYNVTQAFRPTTVPLSSRPEPTMINPVNQRETLPPFSLLHNPRVPSLENENAVMTNAILTVLSASPTSMIHASNIPVLDPLTDREGSSASENDSGRSAFKRYRNYFPIGSTNQIQQNPNGVSTYKRIIFYFKSLHLKRFQELHAQSGGGSRGSGGRRPTSSQLHHMISERKRRVKMNDSFDALRALLPPGTKNHKALVLNGAIGYLKSLQTQVSELTLRNRRLEAHILPRTERGHGKEASAGSSSSAAETEAIRVNNVSESTSNDDDRLVDVRVAIRSGEEVSMLGSVTRIVEFLSRVNGLTLMSMEAETILMSANLPSTPTNHISFRLRIEGSDWDELAFREALRRLIANVAPSQR